MTFTVTCGAKPTRLNVSPTLLMGCRSTFTWLFPPPPKLAVATIIGKLKGSSSHHINHAILSEKGFAWQAEYGAVTFSERYLPEVVAYVQNQKQHHAEQTIWANLENIPSPRSPGGALRPLRGNHRANRSRTLATGTPSASALAPSPCRGFSYSLRPPGGSPDVYVRAAFHAASCNFLPQTIVQFYRVDCMRRKP